ncbi:MAG TPA: amidohydrolase family protein [Kofleriaceae bacterium]|nr:amidohydrolase family protein [Kofleriaceae bacterium]
MLTFSVLNRDHRVGEAEIRIEPDGKRVTHFAFHDRGRGPDTRATETLDRAGALRSFHVTGVDYAQGPVDEQLEEAHGMLRWRSPSEHGQAPIGSGWYVSAQTGIDPYALLARALRHATGHRLKLLPGGEAWIEDDTEREIPIAGVTRHLHRVAIAGLDYTPQVIWLDEDDEMFAGGDSAFAAIRTGAEAVMPALLADTLRWSSARAADLAHRLAHRPPDGKLAFIHARLYDSERGTVVPDATVVVAGDRIAVVGDAATPVPAGSRVIDAHGRTLLPGLWDMHVHMQIAEAGLLFLASGVTTVRDLGNHPEELDPRVERLDAGTEIGPHVLRAGLIDAPGDYAAPYGIIASNLSDALAAVSRYADAGYVQIKIYSSIPPPWVRTIAAAAHARGLRVSGHIPSGMNAADAVLQGFDEIQHANYLFLRFLAGPGDDTRTLLRITRVAERGGGLDLDGPDVRRFLDLLVAHRTVLDPTLVSLDGQFNSDPGDLEPMLVPYADRLPAQVVRLRKSVGLAAPGGQRGRFRASFAALQRLIKRAWDRGIPIVAGTDRNVGMSLIRELELYVQAGIPIRDVLSLATIGAARVMGQDGATGSIAAGKRADLVLVDGDPTRDLAALRNTDVVVCRGVVYDPAELFVAAGMRSR